MLTSLFKDVSFSPLLNLQPVFHLWKSIDLSSAWVNILTMSIYFSLVFPRAFSYAALSKFWCGDLKLCSLGWLLVLALS